MNVKHGYVTKDVPQSGLSCDYQKELVPAPQMALEKNNPNGKVEVGQQSYQFVGSVIDIITFLTDRKDVVFKVKVLESNEKWGVEKDQKTGGVTITIIQSTNKKSEGEQFIDSSRKGVTNSIRKSILPTQIIVIITSYRDESTKGIVTHSFDTPSVTCNQIADYISSNILKGKSERDKGSTGSYHNKKELDLKQFDQSKIVESSGPIVSVWEQVERSRQLNTLSKQQNKKAQTSSSKKEIQKKQSTKK